MLLDRSCCAVRSAENSAFAQFTPGARQIYTIAKRSVRGVQRRTGALCVLTDGNQLGPKSRKR